MSIASNIQQIKSELPPQVTLVAVSKTKPAEAVMEAYSAGHRAFGENKVQEMAGKYEQLPKDIEWHLIGHLQTNKVKYIASFVHLIHSVDSVKLLAEINKQAKKNSRTIDCLLQIHIAKEETKFGLSFEEVNSIFASGEFAAFEHVRVRGLMGMATNTGNEETIRNEFHAYVVQLLRLVKILFLFFYRELFLGKLEEKFTIEEKEEDLYKPQELHNISMYLDGKWYSLKAKPGTYIKNDPVESLDVSILSKHVLGPVLGIHDLKTDKRISFVPGIKGMKELKSQVDSGKAKVAFGMYPVTMDQLKAISDTDNIMPPKSTWVEPKLRSGLVIFSLSDS